MPLTVADAMHLPAIQAGAPEILSNCHWDQTIRWVHSSDLADLSTLLQGGELILTTGAALADAPHTYLRGLADAGALGVIVELGSVVAELPDGVADIAKQINLMLVALHREVRFVDVTEAVHRLIVADQYQEITFAHQVHETFTELSVKRAPPGRIVDAAARILDEPVVLEDLAHQALVVSADIRAEMLTDWERRSRLNPGQNGQGDGAEAWAITGVGPRSQVWGRLVVPREPTARTRTKMVLERAAAALAMYRMIEWDRSSLHHQAQGGLVDDVLNGRIVDDRDVAARAHALGLQRSAQYLPAVIRVARSTQVSDPVAVRRRNVALLDAVAHTVNAAGHSGLFSLRGDGVIAAVLALKDSRPASAPTGLATLGNRLRQEIHRVDGGEASILAVGPGAEQLTDAISGLSEAANIAQAALSLRDDDRPYYRASDVRLRGLISLLRDDRRVQQFAETELKGLLVKDIGNNGLSALTVLREYLRLAGNKAALADRLHISRPALYKRLAAIRDALGVDLDDGESMASLHVALIILERSGGSIASFADSQRLSLHAL